MSGFFSKLGSNKRNLEWFPLLLVRLCSGLFFLFSGYFKIFDASHHKSLLKTMIASHIPFPEFSAYFIPILELICGGLLIIGLLSVFASFILFVIMIVVLFVDRLGSIAALKGVSFIEHVFYLPEALYALIFLWLFFSGPGKFSVDHYIGKK